MANKPNLFLIGAPKCGTTALATNISQHKDIYLPNQKEPRYFDRAIFYDNEEDYFTKTIDDYLKYYNNDESKKSLYRMDASVFNMYKTDIQEILEFSPDAKFIIILRDPVEASISMHRQRLTYVDTTMREVSEDFNECWDLLEDRKVGKGYPKGCKNKFLFRYDLLYSYEKYLPYLIEKLGDKLFIGFYDEYKNNPNDFFDKLFEFLEIEKIDVDSKKINESLVVKKTFFLTLLEYFIKYTLPLRKILGLTGLKNLKQKVLKFYKVEKKDTIVNQKVYDYFKSTYEYMEKLRNSCDSKNPKQ